MFNKMHENQQVTLCFFFLVCRPAIDLVVIAEGEAEAAVKAELAEETGLVEEDLVAVSYMGDELDLETVGDIIAIIEEKVRWRALSFRCLLILTSGEKLL